MCRHAIAYLPCDQASGLVIFKLPIWEGATEEAEGIDPTQIFSLRCAELRKRWAVVHGTRNCIVREGKPRKHQAGEVLRRSPVTLSPNALGGGTSWQSPCCRGGDAAVTFGWTAEPQKVAQGRKKWFSAILVPDATCCSYVCVHICMCTCTDTPSTLNHL